MEAVRARRAIRRVLLAMLFGTSCAHFCTEIGCLTGVNVTFPKDFPVESLPLEVTICADQTCETTTLDPASTSGQTSVPVIAQLQLDDRSERDVVVRVEIRSAATHTVLIAAEGTGRLRRAQPNGSGCEPVCYTASLTYDEGSDTLIQR